MVNSREVLLNLTEDDFKEIIVPVGLRRHFLTKLSDFKDKQVTSNHFKALSKRVFISCLMKQNLSTY